MADNKPSDDLKAAIAKRDSSDPKLQMAQANQNAQNASATEPRQIVPGEGPEVPTVELEGTKRTTVDQIATEVQPLGTVETSVEKMIRGFVDGVKAANDESQQAVRSFVDDVEAKVGKLVDAVVATTHLSGRAPLRGPAPPQADPHVRPTNPVAAEIVEKTGMSPADANIRTAPGSNL